MNSRYCLLLLAAVLLLPQAGFAGPAKTAGPKLLGTFGSWKANATNASDQICYMTLSAHFAPDKKLKRGEAWLTITHRPGENSKDVVSYVSGYNFKEASDVTVAVGKKSFDLFTQKDTAWSRDAATDHALAAAIRTGGRIKITGVAAAKGVTPVSDTIDLKGADQAYRAIGKACGYPDDGKQTTENRKQGMAIRKTNTH